MQRRAAALYGAFFLVLAVGSYGMIAAASAPTLSVEDPDHRLSDGGQLTVDDRTYDVAVDGGEATLSWTDTNAVYTETWADGDDVTLGGTNYSVAIPGDADPPVAELTEARPLPEDVETTEVNGTEYVVLDGDDDTRELVAVDAYLDETYGEAETRTLEASESVDYRGNLTTVTTITNESVVLEWRAPRTNTVDVAEGDVVDLNGVEFAAHFPDGGTLVLDRDVEAYERQLDVQATHHERTNGLWGVSILSSLAVVLLFAFAYLPSRY
jgi:hypothetical protein